MLDIINKKGYFFDLDGTLVDSSKCHASAFEEVLAIHYPDICKTFNYEHFKGESTPSVFRKLGITNPKKIDFFVNEKRRIYLDYINNGKVSIFSGALRLLRILSNQNTTLSDLINFYPKTFSTPETRFDVDESRKFIIIDEVKERLKKENQKIIDIDGVRVENEEGWFLIRASNTQNQLTCRAESISKKGLLKLIDIIEYQLSLSDVSYKFKI